MGIQILDIVAAKLTVGVNLAGLNTQVHAVGVRESPEYFYKHTSEVVQELGLDLGPVQDLLHICDGQGLGYTDVRVHHQDRSVHRYHTGPCVLRQGHVPLRA